MKTCPTCGNRYRPDVTECPNDGTKLTRNSAGPPPENRASAPVGPRQKRVASGYSDDEIGKLTDGSGASTWIVALLVCLGLFGAFFVARGYIPGADVEALADADPGEKKKKKKRKRKKRRKGERHVARPGEGESYDDYDWEQDFEVDDSVLGDVQSEREQYEDVVEVRAPEPYSPKPDEWQASGSYKPRARWSEPGADSDVVEIDLSSKSSSSPLDETQVKRVLDERRMAPCYDPWVQKIPQMRGRVHMTFIVAPDGHVASVKITRSQLRSKVVEKCLVKRSRRLRFPRAQGDARTKFDTHFDFTNQ